MLLTPEERADAKMALKPFRRSLGFSLFLLIVMVMFGSIMVGITGNALVMNILLAGIVSPLFILGYSLYRYNNRRIAEGKTSISVGKYTMRFDFNHRFNQGGNLFYMLAGAAVVVGVLTFNFKG